MEKIIQCLNCGRSLFECEATKEMSDTHLKASCPRCGAFIKFLRQSPPGVNDFMPFGKHVGKTIREIVEEDRSYAEGFAQSFEGRYQKAFESALEEF